jgi:hypothetical protein
MIDLHQQYTEQLPTLWKHRTNQPYKSILPVTDNQKHYHSVNDFICYKVNDQDKKEFEQNYTQLRTKLDQQNHEIMDIYSKRNIDKHKKYFEYNNKHRFQETLNKQTADLDSLKTNYTQFLESEENKLKQENTKINEIIDQLDTETTTSTNVKGIKKIIQSEQP